MDELLLSPDKAWKLNLVLQRLYLMGAPKVLMACIILLTANSKLDTFTESIEFIEVFSGDGWVSKCMKANGIATVSFDIRLGDPLPGKQNAMDLLSDAGLVLVSILNAKFDSFMALFGLVCSSYVTISKGSHYRCPSSPLGLESMDFVKHGNEFTAKTTLLILAVVAMGGSWMLEQPRSSLLTWHPRIRLLWRLLPKVYQAKWWAGMYGAPTWKRHIGWSSSPTIQCLDLGRLCKKYKDTIAKYGVKSTKQYKSKTGVKRFAGSKALKSTGSLGYSVIATNLFSLSVMFAP
ncbi:Uncharacterized protein SCF082_LOCUS43920 [Durusdinium trenchii]|uniref:Uncharacterized protein n=1 Tax=Durusdinium trenchii TaxID=1381693 RepID=A0ABP0R1X6_9DINO